MDPELCSAAIGRTPGRLQTAVTGRGPVGRFVCEGLLFVSSQSKAKPGAPCKATGLAIRKEEKKKEAGERERAWEEEKMGEGLGRPWAKGSIL